IPLVGQYIARRVAAGGQPAQLAAVVRLLAAADESLRETAVTGLYEALEGKREVAAPEGWSGLYPQLTMSKNARIRERARLLALIFGDPQALAELRAVAADARSDAVVRAQAIAALTQTA